MKQDGTQRMSTLQAKFDLISSKCKRKATPRLHGGERLTCPSLNMGTLYKSQLTSKNGNLTAVMCAIKDNFHLRPVQMIR